MGARIYELPQGQPPQDIREKQVRELRAVAAVLRGREGAAAVAVGEWLDTEAHLIEVRGLSHEGHSFHALKVARTMLEGVSGD